MYDNPSVIPDTEYDEKNKIIIDADTIQKVSIINFKFIFIVPFIISPVKLYVSGDFYIYISIKIKKG